MKTVTGTYSSAKIFAGNIEEYAISQIQMLCDNEVSQNSKMCIMPDVHPGKVGPVGLTMTVHDRILPNLIGVDIGCGMTMVSLKDKRIEGQKLDAIIRERIPAGFRIRIKPYYGSDEFDVSELTCRKHVNEEKALLSLGTLGGGNHFIEVDKAEDGQIYLLIHSGSRHLGVEVTEYFLREGQRYLKSQGVQVPYELTWLDGKLKEDYLHDLKMVQEYAALNRDVMISEIVKGMKWKVKDYYSCIHNYVQEKDSSCILRKGAISAAAGEDVIIPINMRDGVILGKGLGNSEWNESAPHGSGRLLKRSEVGLQYTVSDFKKSMQGIYCSCIAKDTLDEAPFAYRGLEEIQKIIQETVEIKNVIRPVYNYKAGGNE